MNIPRSAATAAFALLFPLSSHADGTAEDYARAASLRSRWEGRVLNESIEPHWTKNFVWYERARPDGEKEFAVVDLKEGSRRIVADREIISPALAEMLEY